MRSSKGAMSSFAAVVAIVKVRSTSPTGSRQLSQRPAKASGAPSARATFGLTEPGVTAGSGREAWAIAADVVSTMAKAAASLHLHHPVFRLF